MCLRIEVSNKLKCFGNLHLRDYRRDIIDSEKPRGDEPIKYVCMYIRRTFNSTQGSSRPHTMHISWKNKSIPRMWTDFGKTRSTV